jgi:hypothetical protein
MGSGGNAPTFLTSALDGGEWSDSCLGRFIPKERATGTHYIGDWVSRRAGLDVMEKRKVSSFCQEEIFLFSTASRRSSLEFKRENIFRTE